MKYSFPWSAGVGLAVLALTSGVVLAAPDARAACIGGNPPCSAFTPDTPTDATFTFGGGQQTGATAPWTTVDVAFRAISASPFPITLTNIRLFGDGLPVGGVVLSFGGAPGEVTLAGNGLPNAITSQLVNLQPSLTAFDFNNSRLSFTIPQGLQIGSQLAATLTYQDQQELNNRQSSALTSSVPGPLPILGAASAFGFSRSMRRRIKAAKAAA